MLCDGNSIPLGVAVDGANRNDMKLVEATLTSIPVERPDPTAEAPQNLCMDKGYDYTEVRETVAAFGYTAHIRARGEEAQALKRKIGYKARRWAVERLHSWLNRFRRLLIRWEKRLDTYLAFLHLACAWITIRPLCLPR